MSSENIVDDHRNMLMVSKKISDFQITNMKSWAKLFFPDIMEVGLKWNFIRKNKSEDFYAGKVEYSLRFPKGYKISDAEMDDAVSKIIACTKFLYWKETKVTVKKNGKIWKMKTISLPQQEQTTQKTKSKA